MEQVNPESIVQLRDALIASKDPVLSWEHFSQNSPCVSELLRDLELVQLLWRMLGEQGEFGVRTRAVEIILSHASTLSDQWIVWLESIPPAQLGTMAKAIMFARYIQCAQNQKALQWVTDVSHDEDLWEKCYLILAKRQRSDFEARLLKSVVWLLWTSDRLELKAMTREILDCVVGQSYAKDICQRLIRSIGRRFPQVLALSSPGQLNTARGSLTNTSMSPVVTPRKELSSVSIRYYQKEQAQARLEAIEKSLNKYRGTRSQLQLVLHLLLQQDYESCKKVVKEDSSGELERLLDSFGVSL